MLTVTFIRHGESEDNTKGIWAGWKDAPLSELGCLQAEALGKDLASTKFDVIYASPLLRAHATAVAVQSAQLHCPPLVVNANLREHHFGIAEGYPWVVNMPEDMTLEEAWQKKIFTADVDKFPGGESMDDLGERALVGIREVVLPHLLDSSKNDVHIAIASHGHCIAMLIKGLLSFGTTSSDGVEYFGLVNTAWTRAVINVDSSSNPSENMILDVKVVKTNQYKHLENVKRPTTSTIAASEEAKAFFGGGSTSLASAIE